MYVRKHLICELYLKEYIYDKCSLCPPWDSVHALTRLILDRRIHLQITG
jgi:hypothetical protein